MIDARELTNGLSDTVRRFGKAVMWMVVINLIGLTVVVGFIAYDWFDRYVFDHNSELTPVVINDGLGEKRFSCTGAQLEQVQPIYHGCMVIHDNDKMCAVFSLAQKCRTR